MKILPLILSFPSFLITSQDLARKNFEIYFSQIYCTPLIIEIKSSGQTFKENIVLTIFDGQQLFEISPQTNYGYQPAVFFGDFLGNNKPQFLYSVQSGGSGGYGAYEVYSIDKTPELVFNLAEFSPQVQGSIKNDLVELTYEKSKLYLPLNEESKRFDEKDLTISMPSVAFPVYNPALKKYYLKTYQPVYMGYRANNLGYLCFTLELTPLKSNIINISTSLNH